MQKHNYKVDPLADSTANDPENIEDPLPYPYSLVVDVLNETILHRLNL